MYPKNEFPLYFTLNEIKKAANGGLNLIAISMATTLPDICAALSSEDGKSTKTKYIEWCEQNISKQNFSYFSPSDLYQLRCGLLHQGNLTGPRSSVKRAIFLPKGTNSYANNIVNDAYFYSVDTFCNNLCDDVYKWCENSKNSGRVLANSQNLYSYKDGFPPYVSGGVVIA
jgi:hypothetical protein